MADTKLSALTEVTGNLSNVDEFYVNDGSTSKRITRAGILASGGIYTQTDGAIGDSHAAYTTGPANGRPWSVLQGYALSVSLAGAGALSGGISYFRQITDADNLNYRLATVKTSGNAYYAIYAISDDGFPTGAPLWTHQFADATTTGNLSEIGLTPWSFDRGWYWCGLWNPDDGGGTVGTRSIMSMVPSMGDPSNAELMGITHTDGATSGGPPTLDGTETWTNGGYGVPHIGVVDSTS